MRVAPAIVLTDEQKAALTRLSRFGRTSVRLAQRARIVLLAAQGLQNKDITEQFGIGHVQVARWRERFLQAGVEGIERDVPRGAPPVKVNVAEMVQLTTQSKPAAATHWSTRKLAAELGVAASTAWRHWQSLGFKPTLRDALKELWTCRLPGYARQAWKSWYAKARRSRIEPLKRFAANLKP